MGIQLLNREKEGKKTPTRTFSTAQEKQIAKATGGTRTPNSGATDFSGKGDVLTKYFLLEAKTKTSSSKSMSIKKEWFEKNKQEAVFVGKPFSALVFNFGPDEENHYIIDEDLFLKLLEVIENERTDG